MQQLQKNNFPRPEPLQINLIQAPSFKEKKESERVAKKIIAPDSMVDEKVKNTVEPKLASKDSTVKEESIVKGGGENKSATETKLQQNQSQQDLKPQPITKTKNSVQADPKKNTAGTEPKKQEPLIEKTKSQKTPLSKALFLSQQDSAALFGEGPPAQKSGVPDLMPDVKDGKFTLLNTKANRFSVFVRRVGLRVFGILKSQIHSGMQLSGDGVVAIKLDRAGVVSTAETQEQSGSTEFDRVLVESAKRGGGDKNVPVESLDENGFVTFVFTGRTYLKVAPSGMRSQWVEMGISLE